MAHAQRNSTFLFRENRGQVRDQHWRPRPDVLFHGRAQGLTFHLLSTGLLYQIDRPFAPPVKDPHKLMELPPNERFKGGELYRIDLSWVGANPHPLIQKGTPSPDYENFYNVAYGNEPALFVRRYAEVRYQKVWPGIDILFHSGKSGEMEYTYIIAPGSSVSQIQVQVAGAELAVEGAYLIYRTPLGEVREGPLRAWQADGKEISACWLVEGNTIRIRVEDYDSSQPLYIDPPTRVWGTYYGGSGGYEVGWGLGLALDNDGNIYLATDSNSSDQIASTGAHQTIYGGGMQDLVLVKFDTNGVRLWGTYYGGSDWDYGGAVAVDPRDNSVYLAGGTGTRGAPIGVIATAGAHQTTFGGIWDACLVKFTPAGVRLWGTYYGGSATEAWSTSAVAVSPVDGSVYLTAGSASSNNISTINALAGSYDAFIARFRPNGQRVWGRYHGGSGEEGFYAVSVATDDMGNAYIASYTTSTNLPVLNAHQPTYGGGPCDAFMARFDTAGNVVWSTYYGGTGDDGFNKYFANSIRRTANLFLVAGVTDSPNNIASAGAYQTTLGGGFDAFLVCFDENGVQQWATYYGGPDDDYGYSVGGDGGTGFYLAGFTLSAVGIATAGAYDETHNGGRDAFIVKFRCDGTRVWGTYYGGFDIDEGWAVVSNGRGSLYLAGATSSSTGIASPGAHDTQLDGSRNSFLVRFIDTLERRVRVIITDSLASVCPGQTGYVEITAQGGVPPYQYSILPAAPGWQASGSFMGLAAGVYILRVRDACGFIDTLRFEVRERPLPQVQIIDSLTEWCGSDPQGFLVLQGIGGIPPYEYRIVPGFPFYSPNTIYTGLAPRTYTIYVRDSAGCENSRTIELRSLGDLQIQVSIDSILCARGQGGITVQASGGGGGPFTYTLLSTGATNQTGTFLNLPAGTYQISIQGQRGCRDTIEVSLGEPPLIQIQSTQITPASCPDSRDGSITLTVIGGTPPYSFVWRDSQGNILPTTGPSLSGLPPGIYTPTITDSRGCTLIPQSDTVGFQAWARWVDLEAAPITECPLLRMRFTPQVEGAAPLSFVFTWPDGSQATFSSENVIEYDFTAYEGTEALVRAQVRSGSCSADTTITVRLPICEELLIPNVFTPNGDGINDIWAIRVVGFLRYTVLIYDRWGMEIWSNSSDPTRLWDGRNKSGQPVPEGAYVYVFRAVRRNGQEVQRTGTVTVLR
ncbi:MAG: gliding motility-associated C-terminal domain-containing protein [Bacteroidia bacterium]|nr:gliding motility-associated C-terminal domain-containing protein [Bacteroidia bacterium]MDW8057040.1 gliding motility-associated C-terminal domain-containing protein [Bacteroidia bacterium]